VRGIGDSETHQRLIALAALKADEEDSTRERD
jgi:hypothetical protein